MSDRYTPFISVNGEGVRFGLVTCLDCGAAVLLAPAGPEEQEEQPTARHDRWHNERSE